ncbi:MAG: helix-turn-helix transcriptional regulator [Victivallales bacterium]|nr:helix-turn-helix transcriptional regulator [Victivallales bacterium]
MNLEESIEALEKTLDINVTVVDNKGAFHRSAGLAVFSLERQSHRKIPVCNIGFDQRCIEHCRYRMNAKFENGKEPGGMEHCWKGVSEIVLPLRRRDIHLGMLYAGTWRERGTTPPRGLPNEFYEEYAKLPLVNKDHARRLLSILHLYVKGMIAELENIHDIAYHRSRRAEAIASFINDHATSAGIGLDDLATFLSLSRSRTSYVLQQHFKLGFAALIHRERINRACALLAASDDSLREICHKIGYNDEYHFSKVFKKLIGVPPGTYRTRHRHQ